MISRAGGLVSTIKCNIEAADQTAHNIHQAMAFKLLSSIFLVTAFIFAPANADHCNFPTPADFFGECGPELTEGPLSGLDVGFDTAVINYRYWAWKGWFPYLAKEEGYARFGSVCALHDSCYGSINSETSDCRGAFEACNVEFETELRKVCNALEHECQRDYCNNVVADNMVSLVNGNVDGYIENQC